MKEAAAPAAVCPKCGQPFSGHPALSREDNQTPICPDCGIREALASIGVFGSEAEKVLTIVRAHTAQVAAAEKEDKNALFLLHAADPAL